MASHTVSKSEQYIVGAENYFRFPSPNGGRRVLWTSAPKNLRKCPRVELNRLTRLLEAKGLSIVSSPQTLRYIKKAELLTLIEPLLQFE